METAQTERLARAWNWTLRQLRQRPAADPSHVLQQAARRYHLDVENQNWLLTQLKVGLFVWPEGPGTLAWSERVH